MAQVGKKAKRERKGNKDPESAVQGGGTLLSVLGLVLPVLSVIFAFVAVVVLFRRLIPPAIDDTTTTPAVVDPQVEASSSNIDVYDGVEDPWVASNRFSTGNKDLDVQVKEFCDALTVEGATAQENAQTVYNTIVWSEYEERAEGDKPSGSDWDIAAARHYFDGGTPSEGKGGTGDVYEFAAAVSFCLRYFGYSDALAIPVLRGTTSTGQTSSALVIVTDEFGQSCVCDPTLSGNGWMLERGLYDIVVEDIEQDLTQVEAMGLNVQIKNVDQSVSSGTEVNAGSGDSDSSFEDGSTSEYSGYGDYSGYDNYSGYDDYSEGQYY